MGAATEPTIGATAPPGDDMVRFYLGEEPVLRSVHSYDVGDPAARAKDTWVLR